jgi:hypothetical protein
MTLNTHTVCRRTLGALRIALAMLVAGCDRVAAEYVYTRREPAVGRSSPTVFVVRVAVDPPTKTVVWVEDVHDAEGDLGRTMQTLTSCTILDERNWECPPVIAPGGEVVDQARMRDGNLTQKYWSENREFERRRHLLRIPF